MNVRTFVLACSLLAFGRAGAAPCVEFAEREQSVRKILQNDGYGASLPDAFEQLADSWHCLHSTSTLKDLAAWVRGLPSNKLLGANIQVQRLRSGQVLVIWARDDVPDGGRATLYGRSDDGWYRQGSVDLARDAAPTLIAPLGDALVFILEENRIGSLTRGLARVLRVEKDTVRQEWSGIEINNPKITSRQSGRVVVEFERIPKEFSVDGADLHLRYAITLAARGMKLNVSMRSLTPALESLAAFCAVQGTPDSLRHLASPSIASQLPSCQDLRVGELRRTASDTWKLRVEARWACLNAEDILTARNDASVTIRRIRARYRISRVASRGCRQIRAARPNEAL